MTSKIRLILILVLLTFSQSGKGYSPQKIITGSGQLNYSNLDNWFSHTVIESFFTGGEKKTLYQIGKAQSGSQNPAVSEDSPWAATNIHARFGIDIANNCVFPEKRDEGYCCRLETMIQKINILGINVKVLVTGAIFLGEMLEPVRSTKSPAKNLNQGIPFTRHPKAVKFDYKYTPGKVRICSEKKGVDIAGADKAEFCMILQKRWEDREGNVFARRIGGMRNFFADRNDDWVNGALFQIHYGDITRDPEYDPKTMGLIPSVGPMYVRNSKGVMVPLTETGWGRADEAPTHLVMYFSSSYEGIYFTGSPESVFRVDNISLVY